MRTKAIYITAPDAAIMLSVSVRTIYRYIAAGYLDAGTLPGGARRLSRAQVLGCVTPVTREVSR